ncbi:DUF6993 domain-containing protein [Paramicrobacterium agarici]|uniref:DUF6993 domain-containing protein n=1 Tax=Paramicrobacterium agarici TaxID=630514 RepID=A0A2A9DWR3_9MICO|nr:hypothetical protein [Microbacterium agarici]PFG31128.1 hypothetical protein ATJ78_2078 [Microbacterium agarici]
MDRRAARVATCSAALLVAFVLAGCGSAEPSPAPSTATGPAPSQTSTESLSPSPTFDPDGTAADNLAYFDSVNEAVLAENPDAMGMDFINALVDAGFDKAAMEVTEDYSTVGNRAESIQFSVRWNDACLIGQNGESVGGYHSTIMDVLGSGTCLVGTTREIG